jgi:hypothetical protein
VGGGANRTWLTSLVLRGIVRLAVPLARASGIGASGPTAHGASTRSAGPSPTGRVEQLPGVLEARNRVGVPAEHP